MSPRPSPASTTRSAGSAGADLDDVDWLDSDRPFLPALRELLSSDRAAGCAPSSSTRSTPRRRRAAPRPPGSRPRVSRERYAGEDDDEDHPWAVTTDAPALLVEPLVDEHDGWLDDGATSGPADPPLDLPTGPKRHHRPQLGSPCVTDVAQPAAAARPRPPRRRVDRPGRDDGEVRRRGARRHAGHLHRRRDGRGPGARARAPRRRPRRRARRAPPRRAGRRDGRARASPTTAGSAASGATATPA